jgi:hypothetical protein
MILRYRINHFGSWRWTGLKSVVTKQTQEGAETNGSRLVQGSFFFRLSVSPEVEPQGAGFSSRFTIGRIGGLGEKQSKWPKRRGR